MATCQTAGFFYDASKFTTWKNKQAINQPLYLPAVCENNRLSRLAASLLVKSSHAAGLSIMLQAKL